MRYLATHASRRLVDFDPSNMADSDDHHSNGFPKAGIKHD